MNITLKPLTTPFIILALLTLAACDDAALVTNPTGTHAATSQVFEPGLLGWDEINARLETPQPVEVRSRVSGEIKRVTFNDGALVEKGDLLFQIDSRPFENEARRVEGQLRQARAALIRNKKAAKKAERFSGIGESSAELARARAAVAQDAMSKVAALEMQLEQAKLNISLTLVTSPITGRVDRAELLVGNKVAADKTRLAVVVPVKRKITDIALVPRANCPAPSEIRPPSFFASQPLRIHDVGATEAVV